MDNQYNILLEKARSEDPDAQFKLAMLYNEGKIVEKNKTETLKWLKKAASNSHPKAKKILADLALKTERNQNLHSAEKTAISSYKNASTGNDFDEDAAVKMGLAYLYGINVEKNLKEAEKMLRKSAIKGNSHAQYELALIFLHGKEEIQKDYQEAYTWLKKSAEGGNLKSQNEIGYLLFNGSVDKKIKPNVEEAISFWKKAADAGLEEAQYNISMYHAKEAVKYLETASAKGLDKAKFMLSMVKSYDWDK